MKNLIAWFIASALALSMVACGNDDETPKYEEETIENPVTSIAISAGSEGVILSDVGATATVSVSAAPTNAGNIDRVNYTFASGNTAVFTVDNSGKITATGPGETILKVVANNYANVTATCKVTVVGTRVTSVSIDEGYREIALECEPSALSYGSLELFPRVTVQPADASVRLLRFSSSDQHIAYINGDGLIFAKGAGIATIRVEAIDGSGKFAECTVRVGEWRRGYLDRSVWTLTSSPTASFTPNGTTDVYGGPIENLIDDNSRDTRVGFLKGTAPGGPADGIIYFAIDLGAEMSFNYFYWAGDWTNGSGSVNNNTKANRATFYGSNESITGPFTLLRYSATQEYYAISGSVYNADVNLTGTHTYRYLRVVLNPASTSIADNAICVLWRDFKLGYRELVLQ